MLSRDVLAVSGQGHRMEDDNAWHARPEGEEGEEAEEARGVDVFDLKSIFS